MVFVFVLCMYKGFKTEEATFFFCCLKGHSSDNPQMLKEHKPRASSQALATLVHTVLEMPLSEDFDRQTLDH